MSPSEIPQFAFPLYEWALGGLFLLLTWATSHFTRALIWPAPGIVAALLIRRKPAEWISAAVALLSAGAAGRMLGAGDSFAYAACLTLIDLAQIGVLVAIYRSFSAFPYPNLTISQAGHMTAVFGFLIPGLSAVLTALVTNSFQGMPVYQSALEWWASDSVGACLCGPPIILFSMKSFRSLTQKSRIIQNAATLTLCLLACYVGIRYVKFPFVVFGLPLLMAAFHVGGFGSSVFSLCSGLAVIGLWMYGIRPLGLEAATHAAHPVSLPVVAFLAAILPPVAVGLGTDARRKANRALRLSERRFRESLDNSPIGMVIANLEGRWTYTNNALQRILGYSNADLCAFPSGGPWDPNDRDDKQRLRQSLLDGEVDAYSTERRFLHKEGAWVWVHAAVSLVRDEDGSPLHYIGQLESLEARRRAEDVLAVERERLKVTLRAISDAVITTDSGCRITYMNLAAEKLIGQPLLACEQRRFDAVVTLTESDSARQTANLLGQSIVHGTEFKREGPVVLHRPDGTVSYVTDVASPLLDIRGHVTGAVVVLHDASSEFAETKLLNHRATHDVMTNLVNRFEFQRRMKETFERAVRIELPAAVLAIDLDQFKAVNDTGGHAAGDAVLCRVAEIMRLTVRRSDTIARLGGDEFAVILENCPEARARVVAEQILRALNPLTWAFNESTYTTGASLGLAMLSNQFHDDTAWLNAADGACYEAKRCGRGCLRVASDAAVPEQTPHERLKSA